MLPSSAVSDILSIVQNLFSDISPVVWLLLGVLLGLSVLEYTFYALFQRQNEEDDDDNY
jgi:hypothetical protein